jgi:hypothetical protein
MSYAYYCVDGCKYNADIDWPCANLTRTHISLFVALLELAVPKLQFNVWVELEPFTTRFPPSAQPPDTELSIARLNQLFVDPLGYPAIVPGIAHQMPAIPVVDPLVVNTIPNLLSEVLTNLNVKYCALPAVLPLRSGPAGKYPVA